MSDLCPGAVYRLKNDESVHLLAQVGEGGDVGFFSADSPAAVNGQEPLFRVVVNQPDFEKHWSKVGSFPLSPSLVYLAWYGDSDIGSEAKFKIQIDNMDNRPEIDAASFETLERLAVWETSHVLERAKGMRAQ